MSKYRVQFKLGIFFSLVVSFCSAQSNSLIINGAYIILDGGTSTTNINLVVNQSSTLGIVRTGGGHITSEGQYNFVNWNVGTITGNYIFPFGVAGNAADYIPFTFNKTSAGNSNIGMSTWTTNTQNIPHPALSNVAAVSSMTGTADSVNNAIDRFWDIQSSASVSADLTFSYRGSENTTLTPTDTFKTQHWNGSSWDLQAGPGNSGVTAGIGTVGPIPGQTTFSPWILTRAALNSTITSSQNLACNNQCAGTAQVNITGGTPPYSISWNSVPAQTTQTATGLCAGTYTATITDGASSTSTAAVTITEPTAIITGISSQSNVLCNGDSTGSATVSASGGTGTLTYSWNTSPVQTTATATGLSVGLYLCTVTDSSGCTKTQSVNITEPAALTTGISSQTNVLCNGGSSGTATVSVSGGTGAFTYSWNTSPVQLSATASGLTAGSYTCTVTDSVGCTTTLMVNITQPVSALSVSSVSVNDATCGNNNGSATVSASGGSIGTGYLYSWAPSGGTDTTATGLSATTYTVTVTDANGCSSITTFTINNIGGPTVGISSQTNVSCNGGNNGNATVTASGGSGTYTYSWSGGGGTSATLNNLTAGTYTVTVSDGVCSDSATVTITQPVSALSVSSVSVNDATCGNNNGSATVSASGGTIGTGYLYSWAPSGGTDTTATGLSATTYTVTVTDANGCSSITTFTINNIGGPTVGISSQTNVSCNGGNNGNATVTASGGSGTYTYSWSGGGGTLATSSNLTAGTYTVTVSDGICTNSTSVTITQPTPIIASVSTTNTLCGDSTGTATALASGGTGSFSYLWNTGGNTSIINNLTVGNYTVTVTDSLGCTQSAAGTVTSLAGPTANAGADVLIVSGGTTILTGGGPVGSTYNWSPPTALSCATCATTIASPTQTTTYILTVTQNGCSASDTVTVFVEVACGELFLAKGFSPNNDGHNDILYVQGNCIENLQLVIFDRWGEKVFETNSPIIGWDGTYKGKPLDAAAFVYFLSATVNGIEVKKQGNITLVK